MIRKTDSANQAQKLIHLAKQIERRILQIKKSGRAPLYINDLEYQELVTLREQVNVLNKNSLLIIPMEKINDLMRAVYPMYLSLEQFLGFQNTSVKLYFQENSVNNAGGFYNITGSDIYKQTAPGKYDFVFEVPKSDSKKKAHTFGEDILLLQHGYRDILNLAEIYSETRPGNFEKVYEINCETLHFRTHRTLWEFWENNGTLNFVAKNEHGYKKIRIPLHPSNIKLASNLDKMKTVNELDYPGSTETFKLKQESENYLIQKYLYRQK